MTAAQNVATLQPVWLSNSAEAGVIFQEELMSPLDKFGKLIANDLRDSALNRYLDIESGWGASEDLKAKHEKLSKFSKEERAFIRALVTECVDTGIHDFLFSVCENAEQLTVVFEGEDVSVLSDGLQGEIYMEDGWFEKFSQHKEKGI